MIASVRVSSTPPEIIKHFSYPLLLLPVPALSTIIPITGCLLGFSMPCRSLVDFRRCSRCLMLLAMLSIDWVFLTDDGFLLFLLFLVLLHLLVEVLDAIIHESHGV